MISKKYLNDYIVEKVTDERGRTRSQAVYVGGDYTFVPSVTKTDKRIVAALSVVSDFAFIGAFALRTQAAMVAYVIVPFVVTLISLYIMSVSAFSFLFAKDIIKRYDAERTARRFYPSALISAVLAGVALIGFAVFLIRSADEFLSGDILFCLMALIVTLCTAVVYIKIRNVKAVKMDLMKSLDEVQDFNNPKP